MTAQRIGRRGAAALATLGLTLTGLTLVGSATSAIAADLPTPSRTDLPFNVSTKALSAGQYQIAASEETNELFTSSAVGRPPVVTGTISKVDPLTLEVKAQAKLPIVKHSTGTHRLVSTHGIDVDDSTDTVWVTNTRDNQVSVFDRDTLTLKWSSYTDNYSVDDAGIGTMAQELNHPREVEVDENRGLAYVTGANRGGTAEGVIAVYDTTTFERLDDILIPMRADYPNAGTPAPPVPMALVIDEATGTVYTNDMKADRVYAIKPTTATGPASQITSFNIPNTGTTALAASGLAIDFDDQEIYSANQNTGTLDVLDLKTGAHKDSIETGNQALAVAVDPVRDLAYVADFNNGTVAVVDTRTKTVVETVQPEGVTAQANHVTVHNGSAYMVDKFAGATGDVDYSVDPATGQYTTVNIALNSITKITPDAEATVTATAPVAGKLRLQGEGWLSKDGTQGSKVGVKIELADSQDAFSHVADQGPHTNKAIWAIVDADQHGVLDATIDLPNGTTAGALGSTTAFTPGSYGVRLLTGSLLPGDTVRSPKLNFTATDQVPAATVKPSITGKVAVGQKLTAKTGTWAPATATLSRQWLRNGVPIAGATGATYTVGTADFGKNLSLKVSAKNGAAAGTSTSVAIKVAAGAAKARVVKVQGKAKVGKKLTAKATKWAAGTKLKYQWLANGKAVKGGTKATLKVAKNLKGKKVVVRVTGTKAGWTTVKATSKAVRVKK